jgi:hypothetical protein
LRSLVSGISTDRLEGFVSLICANDVVFISVLQISSYYHDKENAYDIQPSYGILYKSRQKIEVVLKKDMRHGAKDRLLIQSMPISEKRLYEERIDRNLFFNGAMVSHDWVEVEVVGLSCKDNVGEGLPFRDYRRCKSE